MARKQITIFSQKPPNNIKSCMHCKRSDFSGTKLSCRETGKPTKADAAETCSMFWDLRTHFPQEGGGNGR